MARLRVTLPARIVAGLDRIATEQGTSRDRVIRAACEAYVAEPARDWPADFFASSLPDEDLELLRAAGTEMEAAIYAARRDR